MKKYFFFFSILVFILLTINSNTKCQNIPNSTLKIYIYNNTLKKKSPIDIWFNDSLVISEKVSYNYQIAYKLFSKGNLRIITQIRGFDKTRTEYAINILNDKSYIVCIRFDDNNESGTIFGLKKTDGETFEPYFEENIFQFAKLDEGRIFDENGLMEENFSQDYSICHLLIKDFSCACPIRIWINDKIVMDQIVSRSTNGSTIYCKLFSEGKTKISAQLSNSLKTKIEQEFEISNNKIYYIKINFPILDTKSSIKLLDQEEGLKLLTKCKLFWSVAENVSSSSVFLKENLENPIPSMLYNNNYIAFQEQMPIDDSLKIQDKGFLEDSRDGQIYKTIKIGKQIWMAENLNFETEEGSQCFKDSIKCNKYGRFYNWVTANKVCPAEWHLSSQYEWELLKEHLGVAKKDKLSFDMLVEGGSSGINALLAGGHHCSYGLACMDVGFGSSAYFWCSGTYKLGGAGFYITKGGILGKMTGNEQYYKTSKLSVRCVKDGLPEDF